MTSVTNRASKVLVLEIDLSSGKVERRDLGTDMREKYLGSRGINSRILYDSVGPETNALSPGNVLILGTGVFAGTGVPAGSRMSVQSKSSHCVFGYSNLGGSFPPELRKAGCDHLTVKGKAAEPVYIWIDDDKVEIRSAAHLWGKNVFDTNRLIKEELGDPSVQIATIGQSGEKLATVANIMFAPNRAGASRTGGMVMGSKNLKAIAVRGSGNINIANKKLVRELSRNLVKRIMDQSIAQTRAKQGGAHSQGMMCQIGAAPIKNLTTSVFDELEGIDRDAIVKYYTRSNAGCPGCSIHHHFSWEIKEGPYAGEKGIGLEGGLIILFGGLVGNSYAPAIYKAINLINDYGLDGVEVAMAIAAATEWYEKGILTKEDLDGIDLTWGNHAAMIEMIYKIAGRQGIGDLFADGPVVAAKKIGRGAEDCITSCKGRISAWFDWRVLKGGYLNEVTAIPACEANDGFPGGQECIKGLGRMTPEYSARILDQYGTLDVLDQLSYNKARSVAFFQDFNMVMDSMSLCLFVTEWAFGACKLKDAAELFHAVTGIDMSEKDLVKAAARIRDMERAFWVREGFARKDDQLKGRLMNEPVLDGPFKGERLDQAKIEKMLDEYYQLRGWDIKTGIPTREKLLKDGLEDVVEDLEKRGKLLF